MRIGIEVQRIFRKKKHGMEVVALELIRQLQQLDKVNEYILFARNDEDRDCVAVTPNFDVRTIRSFGYASWEQVKLPKALKRYGIDFLHATCNTAPIASSVPLILTLHDIIYLENLNFRGSAYQNFGNIYRRFVVPKVVERSNMIITVSEFEKKVIMDRLNVSEDRMKVIPNAVSEKYLRIASEAEKDSFRQQHQLPDAFLMFLGNKAPKKNTRNVILAYLAYCSATNDPLPLVVLDYQKVLLEALLYRLDKHSMIRHFIFPGYIHSDDMPLMYQCATAFLYPSLRESFGLPILESMAGGTPVITSSTSSMPEVAGDAAVLVDPFNTKSIAEGIGSLVSDMELMAKLRQKGFERVKLYSWERSARALMDVYDQTGNQILKSKS